MRKIETQPPRAPDVHAGQSQLQNHAAAGTAGCQVGASSAQLSGLHLGGGGLVDGQALQASGRQGKRRATRVVHKCAWMHACMCLCAPGWM